MKKSYQNKTIQKLARPKKAIYDKEKQLTWLLQKSRRKLSKIMHKMKSLRIRSTLSLSEITL